MRAIACAIVLAFLAAVAVQGSETETGLPVVSTLLDEEDAVDLPSEDALMGAIAEDAEVDEEAEVGSCSQQRANRGRCTPTCNQRWSWTASALNQAKFVVTRMKEVRSRWVQFARTELKTLQDGKAGLISRRKHACKQRNSHSSRRSLAATAQARARRALAAEDKLHRESMEKLNADVSMIIMIRKLVVKHLAKRKKSHNRIITILDNLLKRIRGEVAAERTRHQKKRELLVAHLTRMSRQHRLSILNHQAWIKRCREAVKAERDYDKNLVRDKKEVVDAVWFQKNNGARALSDIRFALGRKSEFISDCRRSKKSCSGRLNGKWEYMIHMFQRMCYLSRRYRWNHHARHYCRAAWNNYHSVMWRARGFRSYHQFLTSSSSRRNAGVPAVCRSKTNGFRSRIATSVQGGLSASLLRRRTIKRLYLQQCEERWVSQQQSTRRVVARRGTLCRTMKEQHTLLKKREATEMTATHRRNVEMARHAKHMGIYNNDLEIIKQIRVRVRKLVRHKKRHDQMMKVLDELEKKVKAERAAELTAYKIIIKKRRATLAVATQRREAQQVVYTRARKACLAARSAVVSDAKTSGVVRGRLQAARAWAAESDSRAAYNMLHSHKHSLLSSWNRDCKRAHQHYQGKCSTVVSYADRLSRYFRNNCARWGSLHWRVRNLCRNMWNNQWRHFRNMGYRHFGHFRGDVHMKTLDGDRYLFTGLGDYTLLRVRDSAAKDAKFSGAHSLSVQSRFKPVGGGTYTSAIAVKLHADTVEMHGSPARILVNGKKANSGSKHDLHGRATFTVALDGKSGKLNLKDGSGMSFEIEKDGSVNYDISLTDAYVGATEGLMGNFDGTAGNSKAKSDQQQYELGSKSAFSTKYTPPANWKPMTKATFKNAAEKKAAAMACKEAGLSGSAFKDCMLDIAATGNKQWAQDEADGVAETKELKAREQAADSRAEETDGEF